VRGLHVHLDGQPTRSCVTPVAAAAGKKITTIEAIGETPAGMNDAPTVEVHLVRNFEAPGGLGEPGTSITAPALANAVFAATGSGSGSCRCRRNSVRPEGNPGIASASRSLRERRAEHGEATQFGALSDDDHTTLPGFSMHQTPVLEPSRLRERETE
jgi:hypothetical protein